MIEYVAAMSSAAPPTSAKRFRLRLSLRSLLAIFLILSIVFAWFAYWRAGRFREHAIARQLEEAGGVVVYRRPRWVTLLFGFDHYGMKSSPVPWLPVEYFVVVNSYQSGRFDRQIGGWYCAPIDQNLIDRLLQLRHLDYLTLQSPTVPDIDWSPLAKLPQLYSLALDCDTTDAVVSHFATQRNLRRLHLTGEGITSESVFQMLDQNPQLEELLLQRTSIEDADLAQIAMHSQLKQLSLRGSRISSAGIAHLVSLTNLEQLQLRGTLVDDEALPALLKMPGLRTIEVSRTRITLEGREKLQSAASVRSIQ